MGRYIYSIQHKASGKRYIGQAKDFEKRWKSHWEKRRNHSLIHNALRCHGREAFDFDVIASCSEDDVLELEDYYIRWYNTMKPNGYNQVPSGAWNYLRSLDRQTKRRSARLGLKQNPREYVRGPDAIGLPKHMNIVRKNMVPIGYAVKVTGQKEWSIASSRLTMEEKRRRANEALQAILEGRQPPGKIRRHQHNEGLPKGVSFDRSLQRYHVSRINGLAHRTFRNVEDAIEYIDSGISLTKTISQ